MLPENLINKNKGPNGINEIDTHINTNKDKTNIILELLNNISLYNKDLFNIINDLKLPECDNIIEIGKYLLLIKYNKESLEEKDLLNSLISELFNIIDKLDIISALKIIEYGLSINSFDEKIKNKFINKAEEIVKDILIIIKEEIIIIKEEKFSTPEEEIMKQIIKLIYIYQSNLYKFIKKVFDEEIEDIIKEIITFSNEHNNEQNKILLNFLKDNFSISNVFEIIGK